MILLAPVGVGDHGIIIIMGVSHVLRLCELVDLFEILECVLQPFMWPGAMNSFFLQLLDQICACRAAVAGCRCPLDALLLIRKLRLLQLDEDPVLCLVGRDPEDEAPPWHEWLDTLRKERIDRNIHLDTQICTLKCTLAPGRQV